MSDKSDINSAVYGIVLSKILHYGLTSGLFNTIALSDRGMTLREISDQYSKYNQRNLERFLNAAVAAKLLTKKSQYYRVADEKKRYYLVTSQSNLVYFMNHMLGSTIKQYNHLEESLCQTKVNINNESFEQLYNDRNRLIAFLDAMWSIGYSETVEIVNSHLLHKVDTIVDLGGGSGVFSILSLLNNKASRAIVFDLPQIEFYINNKADSLNLAEQLHFCAGDFFKNALPKADLYSLGYICSDWGDEMCLSLINKVFLQLSDGGQIIIMEKLFNESKIEPFETAMMDLCMMVETQGKHRSYEEYKAILEAAGFCDIKLIKTTGEKHAILGRR